MRTSMAMNKIFLFGIDKAGKTSIVNAIKKIPNPGETKPTKRFNINELEIKNTLFVIWDAPGQTVYRERWPKGVESSAVLCFVLDVLTPERFDEAREVLQQVLENPETNGLPLVICFHKIDVPDYKNHLAKAKEMFDPSKFESREVHALETTIFNPDSILELEELFVNLMTD